MRLGRHVPHGQAQHKGRAAELVEKGARVLAETPPAPTLDGLRELWAAVGGRVHPPVPRDIHHAIVPRRNEVVSASFEGRLVYRNPWIGSRLSEDDIAVASFLDRMGSWARSDGPEPYTLADACQDHALGLAIEESAATNADVRVVREPWAR